MKTQQLASEKVCRRLAVLCAGVVIFMAGRVLAVTLSASSATAAPGDVVQICVDLASEGYEVAGVQTDLVWSPQCAEIDESSCQAGAHGKPLHKSLRSSGRLKVLVLALDNVDPIPDGSRLYCCSFRVRSDAAMTNCPVTLQNVGASDPRGNAITVNPLAGAIRLTGTGRGEAVPQAPRSQAAAPAPGAVVGDAQAPAAEAGAPAAPPAGVAAGAPGVAGGVAPVIIATPPAERAAEPAQPAAAAAGQEAAREQAARQQVPQPPGVSAEAAVPASEPATAAQPTPAASVAQPAGTVQADAPEGTTPAPANTSTSKPVATATRQPVRVATPTEKIDESACQVVGGNARAGTVLLAAGAVLLAALRRRRRTR